MIAWIVLLILIAGEAGGFTWWIRKEYNPVLFSGWAALIYSALLAVDFIAAWGVSRLVMPGGSVALAWLSVLGVVLVLVVLVMTFVFRWILSNDITDIPE
jgi:hypothetical protein